MCRGGETFLLAFKMSECDSETLAAIFRKAVEDCEGDVHEMDDEIVFVNGNGQRIVNMGEWKMFPSILICAKIEHYGWMMSRKFFNEFAKAIIEAAVSIILLFGGNDIQRPGANADKLKNDFQHLIELIKQINPVLAISVCEILPRGTMNAAEEKIRWNINAELKRILPIRWGVS